MKVKHYIQATFLNEYKNQNPFYFWKSDDFFPLHDEKIKKVLSSPENIVIIAWEDVATPYQCPFELDSNKRVLGWAIGGPNKLYGIYVRYPERGKGCGSKMLNLLWNNLGRPEKLELHFSHVPTFTFAHKILKGRSRLYVDVKK